MLAKRLALKLLLHLIIILTVSSEIDISQPLDEEPPPKTIDKDICRMFPDGLIDTGFVKEFTPENSVSQNYIFRDRYFWRLTRDLKSLEDRISTENKQIFLEFNEKPIDIAFVVQYALSLSFYFIQFKPKPRWTRYDQHSLWGDDHDSGDLVNSTHWSQIEPILNNSVAMYYLPHKPTSITERDWTLVLFITQNRINGSVQRNYTFVEFYYKTEPEVSEDQDFKIPEFLLKMDSKYWIKAVHEIQTNRGIIFVEYNKTGFHCYFNLDFNKSVNLCANQTMIPNTRLFGCRDPEPIPLFTLEEMSSTENQKPTSNDNNDIIGTIYRIIVTILVVIILISFVILPIIRRFKS